MAPSVPRPTTARRIVHAIDKSEIGGGQHNVLTQVSHLDPSRFETTVTCSAGGPLVAAVEERGIEVCPVLMDKRFRPGSFAEIFRQLRARRIELVHAHGLVASTFVLPAARLLGIPVVYSQHGYHHRNYEGRAQKARVAWEKTVIRQTAAVICDSAADRDWGLERGYFPRRRPDVLPPPVDVAGLQASAEAIDAVRKEAGVEGAFPVLGTVGRLDVAKGYPHLLRALPAIREVHPGMRFVFAGDGEDRADLERLTKELGLEDCVRFMGRVPEIPPYLGLYDLYVSSSLWEGLPVAICEAMAAGAVVLATRVGGCPEVVADGETGRIVPAADPDALAKGALEMLADDAGRERMSSAARRRIIDHFSVEAVIPRLEDLYDSLLSRGQGQEART